MERREFLGQAAVVTAFAALLKSSAAGEHPPADSELGILAGEDSPLGRLVRFHPVTIRVGAKTPFKALHVSDTHLNFMSVRDLLTAKVDDLALYEGRRGVFDSLSALAACVLKSRREKRILLHTGDIWDYHSQANYQLAQDAFALAYDSFFAIGNHEINGHWVETRNEDWETIRAEIERYLPNPTLCAAKVVHGVNFVSFDNNAEGEDRSARQREFLAREFARGLPVVLMCHFPLLSEEVRRDVLNGEGQFAGCKRWEPKTLPYLVYGLRTRHERELNDWLLDQPNLKAVLCGHKHHRAVYSMGPRAVPMYIAGCAGLAEKQVTPDYGRDVFEIDFI